MAFEVLKLQQPGDIKIKRAPVGYSWTNLIFSFFVPLFRADWKWFLIQFAVAVITSGCSAVVFSFIYNKFYIQDLLDQGYRVVSLERGSNPEQAAQKIGVTELPMAHPSA